MIKKILSLIVLVFVILISSKTVLAEPEPSVQSQKLQPDLLKEPPVPVPVPATEPEIDKIKGQNGGTWLLIHQMDYGQMLTCIFLGLILSFLFIKMIFDAYRSWW